MKYLEILTSKVSSINVPSWLLGVIDVMSIVFAACILLAVLFFIWIIPKNQPKGKPEDCERY